MSAFDPLRTSARWQKLWCMHESLAYLALIAASPTAEQPVIHSPAFRCTPSWFHTETGIIGCQERIEISLWGIMFVNPAELNLDQLEYQRALSSRFRANGIGPGPGSYLYLVSAPAMICYSASEDRRRVAQCFVEGAGALGREDVACMLIRSRIGKREKLTKDVYSICSFGRSSMRRGGGGSR
jgi:hypothetical protein